MLVAVDRRPCRYNDLKGCKNAQILGIYKIYAFFTQQDEQNMSIY